MERKDKDVSRRLPLWSWLVIGAATILVLLAGLAAGLRYWVTSDSGRAFIVSQIDGRKAGPLGVIRVSGLKGDPLEAATLADIAFIDDDGVWMRARGAEIEWTPFRLFAGDLEIQAVHVSQVEVLRRPRTTYESSGRPGPNIGFNLQEATVDELRIAGGVFGTAANYTLAGGVARGRDGAGFLRIAVMPLSGPGDRIEADATWTADGAIEGKADATGPANGVLAGLLQAPEDTGVRLDGRIAGRTVAFDGGLNIAMGERPVLSLTLSRKDADARAAARIDAGGWPLLDDVRTRTGDVIDLTAEADLDDMTKAPARILMTAPAGRIEVAGDMNFEDVELPGVLQVNATEVDLGRISDTLAGRVDARGEATLNGLADWTWRGDAAVANLSFPSGEARRIAGPVNVGAKGAAISWRADALQAQGLRITSIERMDAGDYTLGVGGSVNIATGVVEISQAQARGGPGSVSGRGIYQIDSGAMEFSGAAALDKLSDFAPLSGSARGQWSVKRASPTAPIRITADVTGRSVGSATEAVAQVLSDAPRVQLSAVAHNGRFLIESGELETRTVAASMSGRIEDSGAISGRAQGRLLRPMELGSARATSLAFVALVAGQTSAPRINLRLQDGNIELPGFPLEDVQGGVQATFGDTISGLFSLNGAAGGQPATVTGTLAGTPDEMRVTNVNATLGKLNVTAPQIAFADGRVRASFSADGSLAGIGALESGALAGNGTMAVGGGEMVFDVDGRVTGLRAGGVSVQLLAFEGEADGDTAKLSGRVEGNFGAQTKLAYALDGSRDGDAWAGQLTLAGEYDRRPISTAEPVSWSYGPDAWSVDGALAAFGGRIDLAASTSADGVRSAIAVADVDLRALTRIARINAMNGRVSGRSEFFNPVDGPAVADMSFAIDNANPVGVTTDPVSFRLDGQLRDSVLAGSARGSGQGFTLNAEARTRMTEAEGFAISLSPDAPIAADIDANGKTDQLWAIFGPEGQVLRGQINADVRVAGTVGSPLLGGEFALTDASFEHADTGLRLTRMNGAGQFNQRSVQLRSFSASDVNGGSLTAQGSLDWDGEIDGGVTFVASNLRALGREDRLAVVSGDGSIALDPDAIRVNGDFVVEQARFSIEQPAAATIPVLPGLRRVGFGGPEEEAEAPQRFRPVLLAIRVEADRRIFVTGRGVDSEWSTDLTVGGSASAPRIDGSARLVRGSLDLAGRRFDLDSGTIRLDGPVNSARVDITASRDAEDIDAVVRVSGTPDDLEFTLTSTPALPQDEVLSRVLFGRSAAQLTALEAAQLAAGLTQLAGGQAAFDPAALLRNATGLDRVSFGASGGAATVSAGKYLAEDVYLQVGAGGEGGVGAEVEWEPVDNVSIISSAQGNGDTRIAVRWKRDY